MGPAPPPPPRGLLAGCGWLPEVQRGLEDMLRAPGEPAPMAALDFDDTCLRGDVSETLLALLDEEHGTDRFAEYERACAEDLPRAYVELVHTLVAGRTEGEARALARRTLASGRVAVRPGMAELVWAMHRHGWAVWVVTASPEVLVQAAAEALGIHPHRVVGMRSAVGPDGRYRSELAAPPTMFEGKVAAIRAATGREPTFAAGDSASDLPLLESARYGLLFDKGDPAPRQVAERAGWWLQPAEPVA